MIELENGEAYIKRVLRWTGRTLTVQQFNPACELQFDNAQIRNVHLIVAVIKVRT